MINTIVATALVACLAQYFTVIKNGISPTAGAVMTIGAGLIGRDMVRGLAAGDHIIVAGLTSIGGLAMVNRTNDRCKRLLGVAGITLIRRDRVSNRF
jgi:hypothetical protein